jgi:hypothetical protein
MRCFRLGLAALVLSMTTSMATAGYPQLPHPDPSMNPIPQFEFDDPSKSLVVRLHFNGPSDVSLVSAAGVFGRSQTSLAKPPMLRVRLIDHYDNVVGAFDEWSPLHVEALGPNPLTTFAPEATGLFRFPFDPALRAMTVTDVAMAQELIEVDLVGPILDFCADNPTEPECGVDLAILSFTAIDPPAEILVAEPLDITLRRVVTNNGPLGIMDATVTMTATATPGSSVSPPEVVVEEPDLLIGEERVREEVFTVECQSFSFHPFTFESEIEPSNPVFVDPDPSNNVVELEVPIECVVPVVINIKPRSLPNSINTRSNGVIPVAILTTVAGEYGTPLDFDATTIVPTSVRFGPPEVVFSESGGAGEAHGRGHIERSYELDEKTKDGDQDMVLHFGTPDAGLQPGDGEACVKGQWLDSNGDPHKFFGCDTVSIVH